MSTEPRSARPKAAAVAEVSEDRFAVQEIVLDDARNDIARLEWLEGVEEKIVRETLDGWN